MLNALIAQIQQFDPDVIAAHSAYGFDLDVLARRPPARWGVRPPGLPWHHIIFYWPGALSSSDYARPLLPRPERRPSEARAARERSGARAAPGGCASPARGALERHAGDRRGALGIRRCIAVSMRCSAIVAMCVRCVSPWMPTSSAERERLRNGSAVAGHGALAMCAAQMPDTPMSRGARPSIWRGHRKAMHGRAVGALRLARPRATWLACPACDHAGHPWRGLSSGVLWCEPRSVCAVGAGHTVGAGMARAGRPRKRHMQARPCVRLQQGL